MNIKCKTSPTYYILKRVTKDYIDIKTIHPLKGTLNIIFPQEYDTHGILH